jgi:hypothetical protein
LVLAFLKETSKTLGIYFTIAGGWGLLSCLKYYDNPGDEQIATPIGRAIVISDVVLALFFLYVGLNLSNFIQKRSKLPVVLLTVNIVFMATVGVLMVSPFATYLLSALFSIYIYSSLKRVTQGPPL